MLCDMLFRKKNISTRAEAEGNPISKKEQEIRLQDQGTSTLLKDPEKFLSPKHLKKSQITASHIQ